MINEIKRSLKSSAIGRWIFPKIGFFWHLYKDPARRRALQKYGYSNLKELLDIAEKEGFIIVPWAGTLLGFMREGDFLKNDMDVDFALLPSGISPKEIARLLVEKYGFKFNQALSYRGVVSEFSVIKHSLSVDFYIMFDKGGENYDEYDFFWIDGHPYANSRQNHVGMFSFPKMPELTSINLHGIDIKVPANYEQELYFLYGKNWRVPDPDYNWENRPGSLGTAPDYGYSLTYKEFMNDKIHP